jgi:hypothetical protein
MSPRSRGFFFTTRAAPLARRRSLFQRGRYLSSVTRQLAASPVVFFPRGIKHRLALRIFVTGAPPNFGGGGMRRRRTRVDHDALGAPDRCKSGGLFAYWSNPIGRRHAQCPAEIGERAPSKIRKADQRFVRYLAHLANGF